MQGHMNNSHDLIDRHLNVVRVEVMGAQRSFLPHTTPQSKAAHLSVYFNGTDYFEAEGLIASC